MPLTMNQENAKCHCGRAIPHRANSTVQAKECPRCTLEKLTAKKAQNEPKGYKTIKRSASREKVAKKGSHVAKNRELTASYWMDIADRWFSRYVRLYFCRVVDGEPYCRDIITGVYYHAKKIDNGHYHSRYHMGTRYWLDNCRPQNRSSNRFQGERDKDKFRENLIKEIGQERFDALEGRKNTITHMSIEDYQQVIEGCKKEIKLLIKSEGIRKWW